MTVQSSSAHTFETNDSGLSELASSGQKPEVPGKVVELGSETGP